MKSSAWSAKAFFRIQERAGTLFNQNLDSKKVVSYSKLEPRLYSTFFGSKGKPVTCLCRRAYTVHFLQFRIGDSKFSNFDMHQKCPCTTCYNFHKSRKLQLTKSNLDNICRKVQVCTGVGHVPCRFWYRGASLIRNRPAPGPYRGASPTRKGTPLEPYRRPLPRVLRNARGVGVFLQAR